MTTTPTKFRTWLTDLPTRASWRQAMKSRGRKGERCSFETWYANSAAHLARLEAWAVRLEAAAAAIRSLIAAEGPQTEGQLTWKLREEHDADDVTTALGKMCGTRLGRETSGEIVVAGYAAGGGELYGMRN